MAAHRVVIAIVAELADAHGSGPCTRKGVGVRVPSSAPLLNQFVLLERGPSLRSGSRLLALAPLTPANQLEFESLLRHQKMKKAPAIRSFRVSGFAWRLH